METKWATVLDYDHRIFVDSKEKQSSQCAVHLVGARCVIPQGSEKPILNSSLHRLGKRKRSNECHTKNRLGSKESFLKNYSNFMNSGLPKRFLFLEEGKWTDFPEIVVQLTREHFRLKNAAIKVEFNGCHLILDALYMIQLDVKTGLQRPIAWVDESGLSFFPEIDYDDGGICNCSEPGLGNDQTTVFGDQSMAYDIKLEIDIGITGDKLEECVEESNVQAKKLRIEQNHGTGNDGFGSHNNGSKKSYAYIRGIQEINKGITANSAVTRESLDSDTVINMFIRGTDSNVNILEIKHRSGDLVQSRLELFEKQIEITRNHRGDANIKYAWLPVTSEALSGIMMYGVGYCKPNIMAAHGTGISLVPTNCADFSANYYDNDENGVRYVVFCRVILGNVELVHPGSKQCHPSSEDFDSGVDDLHNPTRFVVWNMNMNSHIFPEYVVRYTSASAKGDGAMKQSKTDLSGVTTDQRLQDWKLPFHCSPAESGTGKLSAFVLVDKSSQGTAVNDGLNTLRTPKSPWMPIPWLLEAISKQVSTNNMRLVNVNYNLFRSKKITRDDFIVKLRSIVGDSLLRATILSLQHKMQPKSVSVLKVPKQEPEC